MNPVLPIILSFAFSSAQPNTEPPNWPQFRGKQASGVSDGKSLPVEFNPKSGKSLKWKADLPGLGYSAPAVWGDRIFLTTAVRKEGEDEVKVGLYGDPMPLDEGDTEFNWKLLCLDAKTGKLLWEKTCHSGKPAIKRHAKASHANCTPATDGKNVVAFFGSEGLYCYDMDGDLKWKKNFGVLNSCYYMFPGMQWGFASSPVIHDGRLIIECDVQEDGFLATFDLKTGEEIWKIKRDELPTWSTPTVTEHDGKKIILVNGYKRAGAYTYDKGEPIWHISGGGDIPVPTPVVAHGMAFITNAHGMLAPMYAINLDAKGDISPSIVGKPHEMTPWVEMKGGAYMQTPLVYGDYLYSCRDNGVLSCWKAKTGDLMYRERLGGGRTGFTASPVAGDGKVYYTSEEGSIFVIETGPEYKLLAENDMGEVCMATPAICDGVIYIRTQGRLLAFGKAD